MSTCPCSSSTFATKALQILVSEHALGCPYCGETISVLIDRSIEQQSYIEDCEVCCQPIEIAYWVTPHGDVQVSAKRADD